jgi:HEAT repeat protein
VFNTTSDPYVLVALWTGSAAVLLTLAVASSIVILRMNLRRTQRREKATIEKWRPIMTAVMMNEPLAVLPPLARSEEADVMKLLVHFHASLRGEASHALTRLAYRLNCDKIATRLLESRNRAEQFLGILVLGYLRAGSAMPLLLRQATDKDSLKSSYAFWAIVQIDRTLAASIASNFIAREDWPLSQLAIILKDAPDACAAILSETINKADVQHLPRALRLAESLRIVLPVAQLKILLQQPSIDVLLSALRIANAPELLPDVRALLAHENWRVRLHAARALGRIGDRSDIERLTSLLQDREWWVRYRAAEALLDLPFLTPIDEEALRSLPDRFARDIVAQVLAERSAQ